MEVVIRHQRHRNIDGRTFDLGRPAGHVAEEVDAQLHVHHPRHGGALAVVQAFQLGQDIGVALHQIGQLQQQVLPFARAGTAPGGVVEGLAGGAYGAVDVGRGAGGHLAQHLAGGGVAQVHQGAIAGGNPVGADEHLRGALQEGAGLGFDGQGSEHLECLLWSLSKRLSQPLCQTRYSCSIY
ncbi:hypothetical protein D3C81_1377420 [compost metagenome]